MLNARVKTFGKTCSAARLRGGWLPFLALRVLALGLLALGMLPVQLLAYPGDTHQQISFLAARQFNRCVEGTDIPALSTLNVRYAARASNGEADAGFWRSSVRWQYYDRNHRTQGRKRWLWFIETRMHERFDATVAQLTLEQDIGERFARLGQIVSHIQDVTVPAIVEPIYYERFWYFSLSDRFSEFPLTLDERHGHLDELCAPLLATPRDYTFESLLDDTANLTLAAVRANIQDLGATWQTFWRAGKDGAFGRYGEVGNAFGNETVFSCGRKECRLLRKDPIYFEFAQDRHRDAVLATMRVFLLEQRTAMHGAQGREPQSTEKPGEVPARAFMR